MKLNTNNPALQFGSGSERLWDSLSAAAFVGDRLWVASDELTSVERLSTDDGLTFKNHKSFPLETLIRLPARETDFDQEIDIEGMDHHDSYLWIVGSHSIKRKTVKENDPDNSEKKIRKLGKTEIAGNRFILARIPLTANDTGEQELVASANEASEPSRVLKAAQIVGDVDSNDLVSALRGSGPGHGDLHLERFLSIPGKDNGFDIEGLAVAGDRIFIGLRGPVLRGWAVILEVSVDFNEPARLMLRNIGPDGRPYKKHFLELGGLGSRDLCIDGSDLLILAGPTMNLDGPVAVYRWTDALKSAEEQLVFSDELKQSLVVPHGQGADHAEGMTLVPGSVNPRQVLIVYDSPSEQRKAGADAVRADVFDLPSL
jgi:Protein of unknown function (DUF3616)